MELGQGTVAVANNVNLDALISREDFEAVSANEDAAVQQTLNIRDLEESAFFYLALRKPDFQRESSEWDAKRVVRLIKTFIDGDLIPSVILWKHREHLFVIDGSHRLSALIAWVQDDYGDGERSQRFFGHSIPAEQLAHADRTRKLVLKEVGSYADHVAAASNPDAYGPDIVSNSRALGSRAINLQFVRGDSAKAEQSFIRINQQAANITPQELELIRGRRKPDVIAARAVIRRGTGHFNWSGFSDENMQHVRERAKEVHRLLFTPELSYPIKSLDVPVGGSAYAATSLKMVHDFVELSAGTVNAADDTDGARTVEFINRTRRAAELICSNRPGSMGLHPAVFFYSWTGKQQPILFLTMSSILIDLERRRKLHTFVDIRERLEQFIINNRSLFNQIVRKFGTKKSGQTHLGQFYEELFGLLQAGASEADAVEHLTSLKNFTYLQPSETPYSGVSPTRYSSQVKSGRVIADLLPNAPRCEICRGLVPAQAISIDHKVRLSEGGDSNIDNLQITHPYCNTAIKG